MGGSFLAIDNDEQSRYDDIDEHLFQTPPSPESNVKPTTHSSNTRKRVNMCDTTGAPIIHLTDDSLLNQPRRKQMKKRPTAAEYVDILDEWERIIRMMIQFISFYCFLRYLFVLWQYLGYGA